MTQPHADDALGAHAGPVERTAQLRRSPKLVYWLLRHCMGASLCPHKSGQQLQPDSRHALPTRSGRYVISCHTHSVACSLIFLHRGSFLCWRSLLSLEMVYEERIVSSYGYLLFRLSTERRFRQSHCCRHSDWPEGQKGHFGMAVALYH